MLNQTENILQRNFVTQKIKYFVALVILLLKKVFQIFRCVTIMFAIDTIDTAVFIADFIILYNIMSKNNTI